MNRRASVARLFRCGGMAFGKTTGDGVIGLSIVMHRYERPGTGSHHQWCGFTKLTLTGRKLLSPI